MKCFVQIVSIGPGNPGLMNRITADTLCSAEFLILRTKKHPAAEWLREKNISYRSMDDIYESSENFEELFSVIADEVWKEASVNGRVVYAVPDAVTDRSVEYILRNKPLNGSVRIVPGFSYYDYYLSACRELFQTADVRVCPASDFLLADADPSAALLITEIDNEIIAGEIKNRLSRWMDDEEKVYFIDGDLQPRAVELYELDRQHRYDHRTAVAAEGRAFLQRKKKTFSDLLKIMDILRSPEGCPWDRGQTHDSLKPYVIEEAWETVDAIEEKDPVHLAEELGDLLFQVVFHTSIGNSYGEFDISDVVSGICNKMIRRHPHVFDRKEFGNGAFTASDWEKIKREENGSRTTGESMLHISASLPSLQYAEKIVKRLETIPAIHRTAGEILGSVSSYAEKLKAAEPDAIPEMLGRLLFYCAELSFRYGQDGEILLHHTVRKLINCYYDVENKAKRGDKSPESLTFKDLGL